MKQNHTPLTHNQSLHLLWNHNSSAGVVTFLFHYQDINHGIPAQHHTIGTDTDMLGMNIFP
jgi:hypothetical protein